MDIICKELGISNKNLFTTSSPGLVAACVHTSWLKKWMKNSEVDNSVNNADFTFQIGESIPYPWKKIFIRVLSKKVSKVLPLPRYKLHETNSEYPLTFPQLLQYVSLNNQRNLWKETYKKYCQNHENSKESTIVNLMEHDQLLTEVILRLYGCNIIRLKNDNTGKHTELKELSNKQLPEVYETHANLLAGMFCIETDNNFFIIYRGHYENNLLDCLNFSPNLIDMTYTRGLFVIYQLLSASKAMSDRGLSLGMVTLQDIYLTENLWLQIVPSITNNVHCLDASLIFELNRIKQSNSCVTSSPGSSKRDEWGRSEAMQLEKLCMLWVKGRISNLDYLLHLNLLAGRSNDDPQAHYMVPWVTDFNSRCGRNWRDLTKSKYRLNKGDRQLDMTYDVTGCSGQIAHHVSDALSDITCYVYLARRTPKEVLCKHVRNKWVPAEYPASIQRIQEWTPDECIPEFYTDPTVFKSIHEDLPDLGIPTWSSCVEDFIMKHREALESSHVSEHLHHWIDITFGYKLSGQPSVKAKNVCLSLVDGHTTLRRGGPLQLFTAPHPPRAPRPPPPAPPRLYWTPPRDHRKSLKLNDTSEDGSDEEEESISVQHHVSRLNIPSQRVRSRHKSTSRARSLSKSHDNNLSLEGRASSHSRHFRVQKSELGKGIIYLPKEFNPIAPIQAMETLDNFRSKCFFSKAEDKDRHKENVTTLNLYPMNQDIRKSSESKEDDTAYTNHMFQATYDQSFLKKFSQDAHDSVFKERKNRNFNNRYTTDAAIYKQFVTESRRQDMLVIGCLIVEIFLHNYMRPLRTNSENFMDRYNSCRTVLKYNFHALPKCVSYIASLVLNVQPPTLSFRSELSPKTKEDSMKKCVITDKGLPPPTPSQLLQPLLMQHLIPFPQSFINLYKLLSTLHEYEISSNELNILYMYECDGMQCEKYLNIDKTKVYFTQKIAEGKIHSCVTHLEEMLKKVAKDQFDVFDLFITHYIELLKNKDTSVLAAWYLFDTVSKVLGPAETKKKLLRHILNLYEDDELISEKSDVHKISDIDSAASSVLLSRQKFVKLYHHIFLLQLMVRLGLQCFLDNFTQHLVEGVGGYKDVNSEVGTPGHLCRNRSIANKKPRYSDDNLKSALSTTTDIFSPDTSYGSEHVMTPSVDKSSEVSDCRDKDTDNRSENDLFHFETDKERLPSRSSRSKSPAGSISSVSSANQQEQALPSPSPSVEYSSPISAKYFSPSVSHSASKELKDNSPETLVETPTKAPMSPTIDIPNRPMFTSYIHFADDDSDRKESVESSLNEENPPRKSQSLNEEQMNRLSDSCKISDMSSESLIWLAHRLGPVLTCRYITRNLLKMLTLCYIGKDNLTHCDSIEKDEFDDISVVPSKVVGDRNAAKVIRCLTSIVAMYGEQLIIFQYLPHMGELIASCRRRLSIPLEGGVVACLQLIKYLMPHMSDVKVMEQLQDTFLKTILQPCLRLCSTSRCSYPSGASARSALLRKLVDALYAIALRIGPEMTRRQLCVPALQRFFLAFDKATGKAENWPKQDDDFANDKATESSTPDLKEGFLELCRDGSTAEWRVRGGVVVRADLPDLACSPPPIHHDAVTTPHTAQEELLIAFDEYLAYKSYSKFASFIGTEAMERCLKNFDNIRALCRGYEARHNVVSSSPLSPRDKLPPSLSDEPLHRPRAAPPAAAPPRAAPGGWSGPVVGNRIDAGGGGGEPGGVVAYTPGGSQRHLRGDWLIYWEHEIGRPEKDSRFNLKQIKLQTFTGHTQTVKSICCLDNENSFMTGSKDKTVKLWSLRNQGDGHATSQCNWTYTGHKKGVLSLSFIESMRLAVSTDSVVHIWDPFMESVVCQLDYMKVPVSIVRTLSGPSSQVVAATTDATLRVIDARTCSYTHELKLGVLGATFVRCVCASPGGRWVCAGLAAGHVAAVDLRTGRLRSLWRAHDHEVLKIAAVDEHRVITSGLDQVMSLWNVDDGELIAHLKGNTEPVHCLAVYYNELISGTTNNRIGVHTSLDQDASFSSTKLRSDTFKGVLTSMAVLPLNRLLLLGSDNGSISLLC